MFRLFAVVLGMALLAGCGGGSFKIPKEEYRQTVRTLGVLPLLVDAESTISHPQREAVVNLLRRTSAGRESHLIELLQEKKSYFDVRPVAGEPGRLFAEVVKGHAMRGEGAKLFRHYDFNATSVAQLAQSNAADALLVVILNGVDRPAKRWDRLRLSYLQANFNDIEATAAVVLPSGEIVWEYPGTGAEGLLPLQYPDFDEAYYNRTEEVRLKFITVNGLERTLTEQEQGLLGKKPHFRSFQKLFGDIASELQPGLLNPFKTKE